MWSTAAEAAEAAHRCKDPVVKAVLVKIAADEARHAALAWRSLRWLVERHPEGSQAFIPMTQNPFLVIVAPDENGIPGRPLAFRTEAGQGINFHRNIWHGVLTPLFAPGLFAVVDRIGNSANLQEYWYETPFTVSGDVT